MRAREAPVEYSGHVFGRAEISPQCGFMEVEEEVFTGFGRRAGVLGGLATTARW